MKAKIRKIVTVVEETLSKMGARSSRRPAVPPRSPSSRIPLPAVCRGSRSLIAIGEELGGLLAENAVAALGIEGRVESYRQGGIVGEKGELEHAAAILHPKIGTPVRKVLARARP